MNLRFSPEAENKYFLCPSGQHFSPCQAAGNFPLEAGQLSFSPQRPASPNWTPRGNSESRVNIFHEILWEHHLSFSKLSWKNFLVKTQKKKKSHFVNCEMWHALHCSGRSWSGQARNSGKFCLPQADLFVLYTGPCGWEFTAAQKELSWSEEKYPRGLDNRGW